MRREPVEPRRDWRRKIEALGLAFHTEDGEPYWWEAACYRFTADEIDAIEAATQELHRLCLEAVDRLVAAGDLGRLRIPERFWPFVAESWRRRDPALYGRFDLVFDGTHPPKMLEYNADTPTVLLEAAVVQWYWLEEARPGEDQFNLIHERLIEGWKKIGRGLVHFTGDLAPPEDLVTVEYMRDVAGQAGLETALLDISEIGWNGRDFTDLDERPIRTLFKLYPWEWLVREEFGPHLPGVRTRFIEPPWKMLLSNKAILPILWEMFPGHPNLLPAAFDRAGVAGPCVEKPVYGREGAGVRFLAATDGAGPERGSIFQAAATLPQFDGWHALVGSWVIDGVAAGIGMREDRRKITGNLSRFVPHCF